VSEHDYNAGLPRISEKPLTPTQVLEQATSEVCSAATRLKKALEPFRLSIPHMRGAKSLDEMSISEKVLAAKAMLAVLADLKLIGGQ
jgi:hypothetical protein